LLQSFRMMLVGSSDIRDQVVQGCPELYEELGRLMTQKSMIDSNKIAVAFCIVALSGLPSTPSASQDVTGMAVKNVLIPYLGQQGVNQNYLLDCLQDLSTMENARPILVANGVPRALQVFLTNPSSDKSFVAALIIALLAASEADSSHGNTISHPSPSSFTEISALGEEQRATSKVVIDRMMQTIKSFATTTRRQMDTTEGYNADCKIFLIALRSLITNEANIKNLREEKIVKTVLELIANRKNDIFQENMLSLEEAVKVIWALAFDDQCKSELLENGAVDLLRGLQVYDHEPAKKAIDGTLWILTGSTKTSDDMDIQSPQNQEQFLQQPQHIMISYSWAQKDKMRELTDDLKSHGLPIWIDVDQMEGSVLEAMAIAVENASVVIIGLSSQYKESQACRTEAEYAYKLKKPMICLLAEDNYQPKGWLGALLGNKFWYSPWTHTNGPAGIEELVKSIKKYHQPTIPSASSSHLLTTPSSSPSLKPPPSSPSGLLKSRYDGVVVPNDK